MTVESKIKEALSREPMTLKQLEVEVQAKKKTVWVTVTRLEAKGVVVRNGLTRPAGANVHSYLWKLA